MENNLDDVLVNTLEEKPQKKSNKRIILIAVASVVLLGVLGVSSLMLAKQDTKPKNPEFSELEAELEKLGAPSSDEPKTQPQEDEFDKLIADIKSRHTQEDSKPHITQEVKKPQAKDKSIITQMQTPKKTKEPEVAQEKIELSLEEPMVAKKETASQPKPQPKPQTQKPKAQPKPAEKPQSTKQSQATSQPANKSASELFQSVEKGISKGFYLQVGVFGGTPQKSFLNKLKNHPYKTDKIQRNGKVLTRYLIGPFSSKEMAQSKIEQITHEINKPVVVEIR